MSLFLIYFGTDRRWPDLAHHTVLFGPRYRGAAARHLPRLARCLTDFSLYLHAPTVTDPSLAPPGCECFYVLSPVPNLQHVPLDWERARRGLRRPHPDGARAAPAARTLRRHIVTQRTFTPLDFERRAGRSPWQRVLARAAADAERLVPAAQSRSPHPGSLPGRRRHAPGRRACPGCSTRPRPRPPPCWPTCAHDRRRPPLPPDPRPALEELRARRSPLPAGRRNQIAAVYAWCRRCDDAIDCSPPAERPRILQELRRELRRALRGATPAGLEAACFQAVTRECGIPVAYPAELLDGMAMDVAGRQLRHAR